MPRLLDCSSADQEQVSKRSHESHFLKLNKTRTAGANKGRYDPKCVHYTQPNNQVRSKECCKQTKDCFVTCSGPVFSRLKLPSLHLASRFT